MSHQCDGKQRFDSMSHAQEAAHRMAKRHHMKFRAYQCRECHRFHVGSQTGRPRDRRKELKYEQA